MCDIGRRIWEKDYVDGNGGNITIRVGDNLVLCTPTLISKGFMRPEELCLIDLDGRQLAGTRKRTSEALTHLGIMKRQPAAKACVHAHPPHATAFAIANVRHPVLPDSRGRGVSRQDRRRPIPDSRHARQCRRGRRGGRRSPGRPHAEPRRDRLGQGRRGCLLEDGEHRLLLQDGVDRRPARRRTAPIQQRQGART